MGISGQYLRLYPVRSKELREDFPTIKIGVKWNVSVDVKTGEQQVVFPGQTNVLLGSVQGFLDPTPIPPVKAGASKADPDMPDSAPVDFLWFDSVVPSKDFLDGKAQTLNEKYH